MKLHFDCDYMRGAHPELMRRLVETNMEQTAGYGSDKYSSKAEQLILNACELNGGRVFFLVGGTQTNATVIDGLLAHHEGVLAAETAHINVHEAGAIEATGHKVLTLPRRAEGKVWANDVEAYLKAYYADETFEHIVAPGMVYISHPTELGTVYTLKELEELSAVCRRNDLPLYLDGARLGYGLAAEHTDITLKDVARLCDVFYIGGTKVGALFGEAVVVSHPQRLPHFFSLIKQHGALLAKGRLTGLQFETLFTDNLYLRLGQHAVSMALRLKEAFVQRGYKRYIDSPTNQQFFLLPNETIDQLAEHVTFELWGARQERETPVRFVTDWGTQPSEIAELERLLDTLNEVNNARETERR